MKINGYASRGLYACVVFNNVSTGITACTFNGVAMHPMTAQTATFATFLDGVQWFYLLESELPAAGTYTLSATVDGALGTASISAICLYNVAQQAPEAEGGGNNTGTSATVSITTLTAGALILDGLFSDTSTSAGTPGTGQYLLADAADAAATHRQSVSWSRKDTAGATSTTWTTASDNHVYASIAVAPYGTGPAGSPPGNATETDAALALASTHTAPPGNATETESALALSSAHVAPPGNAIEFVTAFALTSVHTAAVGLATETDAAQALGSPGAAPGVSAETDAAQALGSQHLAAPGVASATETALGLASVHTAVPGVATQADTALALGAQHTAAPGVALETDSALALGAPGAPASETDTALALSAGHVAAVGLALGTETALALASAHTAAPGVANETGLALALGSVHTAAPGIALEADTAQALGAPGAAPGIATETSTALALTSVHELAPGVSAELGTALAPASASGPGIALETNTALTPAVQRPASGPRNRTAFGSRRQRTTGGPPPMAFSSKYAREKEWFYFDFTTHLSAGDSVAELLEIVRESGDCAITNPGLAGRIASVFVEDGTAETACALRAVVRTTLGETLEIRDSFMVRA